MWCVVWCSVADEYDYCRVLNAVLPSDVRVIAWCCVADAFDARRSCTGRTYKYVLPHADLDIEAHSQCAFGWPFPPPSLPRVQKMNEAAALLVGEHDFRNFCRIDNSDDRLRQPYVRTIHQAHIDIAFTCVHTHLGGGPTALLWWSAAPWGRRTRPSTCSMS